jgi:hypothetical protein
MDINILKKFKNQFNLVRKAAEDISQQDIGLNIKGARGKEIEFNLNLPPDNEIERFVTVLRPLADLSSSIHYKKIAAMLYKGKFISDSDMEQLESEIQKSEIGPIRISLNETQLKTVELYELYAKGEFFDEQTTEAEKLTKLRSMPFLPKYTIYSFYSYCLDIYRLCGYLYQEIRAAEKTFHEDKPNANNFHKCIYCLSETGSFTSQEHVYPESLGNTDAVLAPGHVCDKCNNEVLSTLDRHLAEHDALALLRVYYLPYNTKTGKFPEAKFQNIHIQKTAPRHIRFTEPNNANKAFECSKGNDGVNIRINTTGRKKFDPIMLGRSLYKVALGLFCLQHGHEATLDGKYDMAREYVLGKRLFPNNLLIKRTGIPIPNLECEHYLNAGTTFIFNILGVIFFLNLEPEPKVVLSAECENDWQIFSLELTE